MPEESNSKFDKILEGYKPMAMGRMFYPRGMKLSEDFINSFHREYDRLVSEGQNPKSLVTRFGKAMKFHANEDRKYPQLDEAAAKELASLKERNTMKYDPRSKKYYKPRNPVKDPDDRRTAQGDHAPGPEGGGQSGHSGIGREVTRAERDKRKRTGEKKTTKFGKQLKKWADDDS